VVIEIVDQAGRPVAAGTPGRILVTLLGNHSFPLIRYEIGDVGSFREGGCPCGRPWPLLESIAGRTVEFLRGSSGNYVSPVYVRHLIGVVHNPGFIRQYQLVQESDRHFVLSIVADQASAPALREQTMQAIERDLQTMLGQEACLAINQVDCIPQPENGKFQYTVNRTRSIP
jgi:phenylacetate-CoA ligase